MEVNEVVTIIKNNTGKRFDVTYRTGLKVSKVRLFVSGDGIPAYFKKGSRTRGFALDTNGIASIEVCKTRKSNLSEKELFAKNAKRLVQMLKESGLWNNVIDKIENDYQYDFDKMTGVEADFAYSILNWKVKKMNFRDKYRSYYSRESINEENDQRLNYIKECMDMKKSCHVTADGSYDVRFDYDAEKQKAWYSEEYKGCANGHYYLAINSTHAIYLEKD